MKLPVYEPAVKLKTMYSNLLYVGYLLYAFNNMGDEIRKYNNDDDKLLSCTKKAFNNSPQRIKTCDREFWKIPTPSESMSTRWKRG